MRNILHIMPKKSEFESMMEKYSDFNTKRRAQLISTNKVQILKQDFENGQIEALIQGSEILPYEIKINVKKQAFHDMISHSCPDFLSRRQANHKFCKHLIKVFHVLKNIDEPGTIKVLQKIHEKMQLLEKSTLIERDHEGLFMNETLEGKLNFEARGFDHFLELLKLETSEIDKINMILNESMKLPAALRGFHGGYPGGLYDHILLVTNYAYKLNESMKENLNIKKVILSAIYHDFGKISYYLFKRKVRGNKIKIAREELKRIRSNICEKFNYTGKDQHVEECFAVLEKFGLSYDDEICKAIIFHHGAWSKYRPLQMSKLATLLHVADMIASQIYFI